MTSVFRLGVAVAAAGFLALIPAAAEAAPYTFSSCISSNNSGLCASLPSQLKVDVTAAGSGYVDFKFTNDIAGGGIASSITALYFDATGFLTSISVLGESAGVDFKTTRVSPPDVPSANGADPDFVVTEPLKADTVSPTSPNGINAAGEYLTLRMAIAVGKTFDDVKAALDLGPTTDAGIRIAAHVQAIGTGGQSDSVICCSAVGGPPPPSIPEPATLALFGLTALGTAYRVRQRRAASDAA